MYVFISDYIPLRVVELPFCTSEICIDVNYSQTAAFLPLEIHMSVCNVLYNMKHFFQTITMCRIADCPPRFIGNNKHYW